MPGAAKILEQHLVVVATDGSKWAVPVIIIANNRAAYYAGEFGDDENRSMTEDTEPLFDAHHSEIEDWARNNMNWADVEIHATRISPPNKPDMNEAWANGDMYIAFDSKP
jgi:hypothetical protein